MAKDKVPAQTLLENPAIIVIRIRNNESGEIYVSVQKDLTKYLVEREEVHPKFFNGEK